MPKRPGRAFLLSLAGVWEAVCLMTACPEALGAAPKASDEHGITTMVREQKTVRCQVCGALEPETSKFCSECGALLDRNGGVPVPESNSGNAGSAAGPSCIPNGVTGIAEGMSYLPEDDVPPGPDDSGLKLLVDCCRKTIATSLGDGHEETVLYLDEKNGDYQIHTYVKNPGARRERHRGFRTDRAALDAVMTRIAEKELVQFSGHREFPMTGGEYVCKYLSSDGRIIRLSTSNVPYRMHGELYGVGMLLNSFIDQRREILPEESVQEQ